jgi:hypothetical protein
VRLISYQCISGSFTLLVILAFETGLFAPTTTDRESRGTIQSIAKSIQKPEGEEERGWRRSIRDGQRRASCDRSARRVEGQHGCMCSAKSRQGGDELVPLVFCSLSSRTPVAFWRTREGVVLDRLLEHSRTSEGDGRKQCQLKGSTRMMRRRRVQD